MARLGALDAIDVAILRELTQAGLILPGRPGVTPSNREISRKLKLPPGTVRYRIRKMYSSGAIRGSTIFPNPSMLGLRYGAYVLDVSPQLDKADAVKRLLQVEGAIYMHDFVGSLVWVGFAYGDDRDLDGKLSQMSEIAESEGIFSRIPYPPATGKLTRPEAELVLRLLKGGFESYGSLARELNVSVRTLQRRMSKIVKHGTVFCLPRVDYPAMKHCVPADLHIVFKDNEAVTTSGRRIIPLLGDSLVFAALWDTLGMCSLILPNVGTMAGIVEKVKKVDGVTAARIDIVREHVDQARELEGRLEKWMEEKGFRRAPEATAMAGLTPGAGPSAFEGPQTPR